MPVRNRPAPAHGTTPRIKCDRAAKARGPVMWKWLSMVVLIIVTVSPSWAGEIAGKWGIGAGLFNGSGEVSLIRGHSDRTAWLLVVQVSGSNSTDRREYSPPGGPSAPPLDFNRNGFLIAVGPGLRRYARPESELSPYFDVSVRGLYGRSHQSGSPTAIQYGAISGLGLGLEYFTRWHFSIGAHAPVATVSWTRGRFTSGGGAYTERRDETRANISVQPSLVLRGYF